MENNTGSCTNKEIRKFQMTLGNFFSRVICRLSSIMTVLKGKYSFCKYSIWTWGGRHQKVPNEPQTLDPFTEWLNFIFKYTNIYFKNGALLLWNLWLVCGKMINSSLGSLESAVCKTIVNWKELSILFLAYVKLDRKFNYRITR